MKCSAQGCNKEAEIVVATVSECGLIVFPHPLPRDVYVCDYHADRGLIEEGGNREITLSALYFGDYPAPAGTVMMKRENDAWFSWELKEAWNAFRE